MLPSTFTAQQLRAALGVTVLLAGLSACNRAPDTAKLMTDAQQYRQHGEFKSAIIQLKNALQNDPKNAAARALLGELYMDSSDLLSAEKEFRRALELGMAPAQALPLLGKALLLQGQFDKVLTELPADSTQPEILTLRGHALLGQNRLDAASALFERALQERADFSEAHLGLARAALAANVPARALEQVELALAKSPGEIDALRFKGDLLRLQGKRELALQTYEHILKLKPNNWQTRIDIANMHVEAGKFPAAKAEIDAARKIAPNNLLVIYAQALLDFRQAKYAAALDQLQLILRTAPEHMPSVLLAGAVQFALGANTQAEQHLRHFLDAEPAHPYANKLLISIALRTNKIDDALKLIGPLLEKNPQDVDLLAAAGEANLRARQFNKAAEYFEKASELAPAASALHAALGASRLGMGENGRAIAELERANADGKTPRAGVLLVMAHLRGKEFGKALAAVKAMEQQGDNPAVQNLKGGVLLASQDLAGARASYQKALALDPTYLPALKNLTQLDLMEKKPEQAQQRLEAALAKKPQNTALMTELAKLAITQGKDAQAMKWLERAAQQDPDALQPALLLVNFYNRIGERQKALTLARKLQAGNPTSPEALALLAQAQLGSGQQEAAIETFGRLAVLQPNSAPLHMQIASTQLTLGHTDEALGAVRKALALQPEYPAAQMAAVRLLIEKNAMAEALTLARTAQGKHPDAALGFKLEGDILMAQDKPLPALKLYEQAFRTDKSGPLMISIHHALQKAGKAQDASARMEQWLQQNPRDLHTRLYLASTLMSAGDLAGASAQYEKALALDPNNVVALNDLAWSYQQRKDSRALAYAERASKLVPRNAHVTDTLGWILQEKGDTTRALALLKQATEQADSSPDIRYHYAMTLIKAGDKRAARVQLEQLLEAKGFARHEEVKALMARL